MLEESNPEEDDSINRKIIDVLQTEIRRLSGKVQETEKVLQPPASHPQPNSTLNRTPPNNEAGLVSTRTVHPQNKIDVITTASNQVQPNSDNSSTAGPTVSTQGGSQDALLRMSMDDAETGCTESSPVVPPPGIFPQNLSLWRDLLTPEDITNDVEQELQEIASVINEACRIIVFVGAGISTNCGIPVSVNLYF